MAGTIASAVRAPASGAIAWPRKEERGFSGRLLRFQLTFPAPTEWNDARDLRCRLSGRHKTHAPTGTLDPDGNCAALELSRVH